MENETMVERVDRIWNEIFCECGSGALHFKSCKCGFTGCGECFIDHACQTTFANSYGVYER